ncbi:MAG: UDP-3-O-(3-hydroxymyristoyl)glucosamine N-acyltransferase [Bacteroidia bacterium]
MKLREAQPLNKIAEKIGATIIGNANAVVSGINEIHKVEKGDLTFVDVQRYFTKALSSNASFIIINEVVDCPADKALLIHPKPFDAYNQLVASFYDTQNAFDLSTPVSNSAKISDSAQVHQGVSIGNNVCIGENSIIYPNVVIYDNVSIGKNVIIHSGSVIGGQAYYYAKKDGRFVKWHSCGNVVINDDVEIGSCCTIDKGVSGATKIGKGTKLDNQVHVGHGVEIGENCLFAAQCGIGGKTIIEDEVICWGQVGITKSIRIGKGAVISAQSGVSKSLAGGKAYYGSPAREIKVVQKEMAAVRRLPDYFHELKK